MFEWLNKVMQPDGDIPLFGDVLENLDDDDKIKEAIKKVSVDTEIIPFYDKEPNITL